MIAVLGCIAFQHNVWMVGLAALVCLLGSWTVVRLFCRAAATRGLQRAGWLFLASVAGGSAIWCTHFIAMLAFEPGVPIGFDPLLTVGSLLIAMVGMSTGFAIAAYLPGRASPAIGGTVVGLAIAAMHYSGMLAYRVEGIVHWNQPYLVSSVLLSVLFSGAMVHTALVRQHRVNRYAATALLVTATILLHFTGMTAFSVTPMVLEGNFTDPAALETLALTIAAVSLIIIGTGLASYLIDDRLRLESFSQLRAMALNDGLTGLPNRSSFSDHIDNEIDRAAELGEQVVLVGIDLDNFKEVNDLRGHGAGDHVLRVVARRMRALMERGEFMARLGGDEFAAVKRLPAGSDPKTDVALADFIQRLEMVVDKPVRLGGARVAVGASFGVAVYPANGRDRESLVSNADLAMYRAKSEARTSVCFYEPSMDEAVRARKTLAKELREALEGGALDIHYQVQRSVRSGEIRGYEALLRWNHVDRGFIPPSEFIPLAEESGLIAELGEWVLRTACARAAQWEPPYKIAVNLSPVQFAHSNLPELVEEVLASTGLDAARLELELTESTIVADKAYSLEVLQRIKALGVSIALDDFGTGYSSLDTLRTFPFDKIKLDRSFMREVETSPQAKAIIRAVLALGSSLEIPVLAEGIETEGQLGLLEDEGCDEGQGFLLGRPAPLGQIVGDGQLTLLPASGQAAACQPRETAMPAVELREAV